MSRREIHNELDRKNRNNHNENYEELYRLKSTINDLVLDSGESDVEVVQARAGEDVLNDRLDKMGNDTNDVAADLSTLERDINNKLDDKAKTSELDKYAQDLEDNLNNKFKTLKNETQEDIENLEFKGVMLTKTKNQEIEDRKYTFIKWDKAEYNVSGFWKSSDPTRITIPNGVKMVRLSANVLWSSSFDGDRVIRMKKNGNYDKGLVYDKRTNSGTSGMSGTSAVVEVEEGDYFELEVYHNTDEERMLREDPYTWFSLEVVDYSKK